jgi:hypothetical protein
MEDGFMDFLTGEQRDEFAAINARVGLGPLEYTCQETADRIASSPTTDVINMHSTGDLSHFKPHMISVGSVQKMREICGTRFRGRSVEGPGPNVPPPPSFPELKSLENVAPSQLKAVPIATLMRRVRDAAAVFVLNDETLVEEYKDLINALLFPGRVAVYTGHTLTVPAGGTLHIGGDEPVFLNFGRLITGDGATIRVTTDFVINFQKTVETA